VVYPDDQSFGLSGQTSAFVPVMAKRLCISMAATVSVLGKPPGRSRDAMEHPRPLIVP
jgi:hypothetical protein